MRERDTYLFDKRVMKKNVTKFLLSCLAAFPILLVFNILTSDLFEFWVSVILDSVILLVFVLAGNSIADKAFDKAKRKRARIRGEHDLLVDRKQKAIEESKKKQEAMQNSYKKIREEKQMKKAQALEEKEKQTKQNAESIDKVEDSE